MHKLLLLFFLVLCSLYAKATAVQQSQEDFTTEEVVQEELNNPERAYNNPRGVLMYDDSPVNKALIKEKNIRDFQKNKEFNYKEAVPEDTWWSRLKQKINDMYRAFMRWLTGGEEAVGIWRFIVEILPYLLLIGFIALIVWIFMRMDSGALLMERIKAPETLLSDDEELIQRQDLQQLIDQALASGNYRLAVRFYYLLVLQKMSGKDLIDWQVQKTNHEYISEIEDLSLRNQFTKVTDIYDYIWYGNFEVDEAAFAKAESSFKTINNLL